MIFVFDVIFYMKHINVQGRVLMVAPTGRFRLGAGDHWLSAVLGLSGG